MKKKALITLILSGVSASGAAGVVAGATYALWSDSETISNHLEAGNMSISLLRTSYSKVTLDEDGYLVTKSDSTEVDFSKFTDMNIFGLDEHEYIVPQSSYQANLRLMNGKKVNGIYEPSSVAFRYDVSLILDSSSSNDLASQLVVTVAYGESQSIEKKLSEFGTSPIFSGTMEKSDLSADFSIKVSFPDLETNNLAQGKEASFDLKVEAVQLTERN